MNQAFHIHTKYYSGLDTHNCAFCGTLNIAQRNNEPMPKWISVNEATSYTDLLKGRSTFFDCNIFWVFS